MNQSRPRTPGRRRTRARVCVLVAVASAVVGLVRPASSEPAPPENKVGNAGFEQGIEAWGWHTTAAASYALDEQVSFAGRRSFRLSNGSKFQPHVYCRVFRGVGGLKENTAYRVGVWVRAKNAGMAWVGGGPGWFFRVPFPQGSYDWQHVEGIYVTHPGETGFELMAACESKTEALWLDDLSIVEEPEKTQQLLSERRARQQEARERADRLPAERQEQLTRLKKRMDGRPELAGDPYVRLGLAVAERFLKRIETRGPDGKQGDDFTVLQAEELEPVLRETGELVEAILDGRRSLLPGVPRPAPQRARVTEGAFHARTDTGKRDAGARPFYFAGYGHFIQVANDLPGFPALGVTLIQDGRVGPSSMNADGSLKEAAQATIQAIKEAPRHGIKVDWLASPHYFPDWAVQRAPEIPSGNPHWLSFQIDHPVTRKVIGDWLERMLSQVRDEPGLLSVCLSNEPAYEQGGRDATSRPFYEQWLERRYAAIGKLNETYGTKHESFAGVAVPAKGWPAQIGQQRAFYDWVTFNQEHWAGYHRWMHDQVKRHAPDVPTHAKIMVFFTMDRDRLHYGVDPELFCRATDVAGCDAYAFPGGAEYAYDWMGHAFWYDLLHSFRGQPVFNSENHIISDGTPAVHVSPEHTYAVFWQGALHHQGATTTWVWEEPSHPSLVGSIYFRPANVHAAGKAFIDLSRFAEEVRAIESRPERIALLYSMPSIIWEPGYKPAIQSAYTAINFMGEGVTFVSERQLAEGSAAKVDILLVPRATHVKDATVQALARFVARGGKVILFGENCLAFDEYHRPRQIPDALRRKAGVVAWIDDEKIAAKLIRAELIRQGWRPRDILTAGTAERAWGIEYRVVEHRGRTLVSVINMLKDAQTVELAWLRGRATDLLTGQEVDVKKLPLEPIRPVLLAAD